MARYLVGSEIAGDAPLPLATFMINVCGAFLLGVLLERLARSGAEQERRRLVRLFAGTGFSADSPRTAHWPLMPRDSGRPVTPL